MNGGGIYVDAVHSAACRTVGDNVYYYSSLQEAVSAATEGANEQPDEITLIADLVLDEPLIVGDGVHIRLVAGGSTHTIRRSAKLIEYPVIWVRGEGASLDLGKPGMEHELIIDGGRLGNPPIEAHAPLAAVSGPDSKLIMYDKVTLQNNINNGAVPTNTHYQNGAGVYVRTQGNFFDRRAVFIMKGGTIRGNINDTQNSIPTGGGVMVHAYSTFAMEGGVIMDNTAYYSGGGVWVYSSGSFKKTGGIIYGANAPAGCRNTVMEGTGTLKCYGHAVAVIVTIETIVGYRNDTVAENDCLSFINTTPENGSLGKGEKWDTPDKAYLLFLPANIRSALKFIASAVPNFWKETLNKQLKSEDAAPKIDIENSGLSDREKEICKLLLTKGNLKEIATIMGFSYSWVHTNAQRVYKKLGVKNRTELLIRMGNKGGAISSGQR